ncbi:hypothetical protein NITHO_2790014 [Nitrolancea hollandica Lb]|uniref:Uncharacterized protein n=1 Tax=Nitrolancea hollandica Lb TaxID=1129897 RepID=I4EGN8_9BACT|nr:hypothetical protein NITHO_2790014 [Nitrolancea hollandica Lb]
MLNIDRLHHEATRFVTPYQCAPPDDHHWPSINSQHRYTGDTFPRSPFPGSAPAESEEIKLPGLLSRPDRGISNSSESSIEVAQLAAVLGSGT